MWRVCWGRVAGASCYAVYSSEGASSAEKKIQDMLLKHSVLSGNKMYFLEAIRTCMQLCNMKTAVRMW